MTTHDIGAWGEKTAQKYLKKKGYKIKTANYRSKFGEIDIIAEKGSTIAFVEVKLRKNENFGRACEFVTYSKQRKLRITAELWLAENKTEKIPQFDVVEIYAPNGIDGEYKLNHIENAF